MGPKRAARANAPATAPANARANARATAPATARTQAGVQATRRIDGTELAAVMRCNERSSIDACDRDLRMRRAGHSPGTRAGQVRADHSLGRARLGFVRSAGGAAPETRKTAA